MTKKRVTSFKVNLILPNGVTKDEMVVYMDDAISSWGGSFFMQDPLFPVNWDIDSIDITYRRQKKTS